VSILIEGDLIVGVGVGVARFKKLKNPPLFFVIGVGVGTDAVLVLLFKLILPVTTAKKTKTTTKPKTNEITLLKLSI